MERTGPGPLPLSGKNKIRHASPLPESKVLGREVSLRICLPGLILQATQNRGGSRPRHATEGTGHRRPSPFKIFAGPGLEQDKEGTNLIEQKVITREGTINQILTAKKQRGETFFVPGSTYHLTAPRPHTPRDERKNCFTPPLDDYHL